MAEVRQYREKEGTKAIIAELLEGADNAMRVDCASSRVTFEVIGWFVFPKGSLTGTKVESAT